MNKIVFLIIFLLLLVPHRVRSSLSLSSDPIVNRINQIRIENHERPLIPNVSLNNSSLKKACDMKHRNYWNHKDPNGLYSWHLFVENGYSYRWAGEDLGKNCRDLYCVQLWMNSPTHRAIILDPVYKDIGVGRCGIFTVTHFGTK